ncbi:MAG TPA: O-antigen ligase family protein [Rhodothermales bacterium]|nr:O-antigen ligase family protein [Rhodothermales bacterium]
MEYITFEKTIHKRGVSKSLSVAKKEKASWYGMALLVIGLSISASAFPALRFGFAGLLVHPYLIPTGALFFFFVITRQYRAIPLPMLISLGLFVVIYCLAALRGPGATGEGIKIGSAAISMLCAALLVRTERDFIWGVLGLAIAGAIISMRGFEHIAGIGVGANALTGIANENAVSLYILPAMLLAVAVLRDAKSGRIMSVLLLISLVLMIANTFLSSNRSGWVGVILIGFLMLFGSKRKIKILILIGILGLGSVYLFQQFDTRAFYHAVDMTLAGAYTDNSRWYFIITSIEIGLDNPLLGVSPTYLPYEIASRLRLVWDMFAHAPHNVFGHLIGGTGFITTGLLFYFGRLLWKRPTGFKQQAVLGLRRAQAHWILRMMLILWVVRGMFSHEILYNPSFCIGIGMALGLCLVKGVWNKKQSDLQQTLPKEERLRTYAPGIR